MMPGDPVVGSTILRRPAIQSPNFVTTVSGWTINADGSAEFNNGTFRGTVTAATFVGTDFEINSAGAFFYSGPPAPGNLTMSVTASTTGGTDRFGNHYVPLTGWYDNAGGFFTQIGAGFVTFGTGSLSGGWTANTSVQNDASGNLLLGANASIFLNGSSSTSGPSPDSTSTNGLSSPGITGTSGAASAGTAHTHSAGSYVVGSGQHSHSLDNHTHPL